MREENPIENVNIFPNPTNQNSVLTFTQARAGEISIEIYNAAGSMIQKLYNGFIPEGFTSFPLDLSNFANGLYSIRIYNQQNSFVKRCAKI